MPPEATVNALRGPQQAAGFTSGGGTSTVMPGPRQADGGRQQATVNALRTYQPTTAAGGPGLQRTDNSGLYGAQEGWQGQQQAEQAAKAVNAPVAPPPPPPVAPAGPEAVYKNPDYFEPSGDNWSGAKQYLTEAELKAQTEAANSEYDQWGIFQGGGR